MNVTDQRSVKRVGMVIGIRPEKIEEYRQLHDGPCVRDLLRQANIRDFTIYLGQFDDGRYYEFATYNYVGDDYDADMAWLAAQPRNQAWLAVCDPMQLPFSGQASWKPLEEIFYNA